LPFSQRSLGIRFALMPCRTKVLITDGVLFKLTIPLTTTSSSLIALLKKFSSLIRKLSRTLTMSAQFLPMLKLPKWLKELPL
jgi:hypothetical protein